MCDHFIPYAGDGRPAAGPVLEGCTVLTAVAARTTRIRPGRSCSARPPDSGAAGQFAYHATADRSLAREPSTTLEGEWPRLTGATCDPPPVQQPLPLLVGSGTGDVHERDEPAGALQRRPAAHAAAGADEFVLRDHRSQPLPDVLRAVDRLVSAGLAAPG